MIHRYIIKCLRSKTSKTETKSKGETQLPNGNGNTVSIHTSNIRTAFELCSAHTCQSPTTLDEYQVQTSNKSCWHRDVCEMLGRDVSFWLIGNSMSCSRIVSSLKMDTTQFTNPNDMLHNLKRFCPDVVFIDSCSINNVSDVCKSIRKQHPYDELPIILLTCSGNFANITNLLGSTINDYLLKPLRDLDVNTRVYMHLMMKRGISASRLLDDIYPKHVLDKLMASRPVSSSFDCNNQTLAERSTPQFIEDHQDVSILFSDICGYTTLASAVSCSDIVELLNSMFTRFDDICILSNVYKVETIGDAYMVAAGHDASDKSNHADTLLIVALNMISCVKTFSVKGEPVKIRIGIHSGPAKSGLLGKCRRRYCFFGDTVNVASRMESSGEPMKIHISDETYKRLSNSMKEDTSLTYTCCIGKEIKGKGTMTTYLVHTN